MLTTCNRRDKTKAQPFTRPYPDQVDAVGAGSILAVSSGVSNGILGIVILIVDTNNIVLLSLLFQTSAGVRLSPFSLGNSLILYPYCILVTFVLLYL